MKDKRRGSEDWYRPWVIRPDLLRAPDRTVRTPTGLGRDTGIPKGRSSSSTRINDIGAKLDILERGPTALNRMTAGYSLANLSQLTEDFPMDATGRFHSLCYTPELSLNRSLEDTIEDEEDEISLFSLQLSPRGDKSHTSHFFAKQKIVQKTLSLPFKYFENEWSESNKHSYSLGREGRSSILTNKTPNRRPHTRRCPSPHAKIANGVFLPSEARDEADAVSLNKLLNSKKKAASLVHEGLLRCHSGRSCTSVPDTKPPPNSPVDSAHKSELSASVNSSKSSDCRCSRDEPLEDHLQPNARQQITAAKASSHPVPAITDHLTTVRSTAIRARRGRGPSWSAGSVQRSACDTCPCHRAARPRSFREAGLSFGGAALAVMAAVDIQQPSAELYVPSAL
ncbi:uncharacterized protein LOC108665564 [Hyalella azteca]|uniref:Uncharacterized protein LOC108665564 n=1 Tax=Hyalella azteca TaxID=294128 RepID=A0A8B7N2M0_HYAAZ|nr:uncharacterized protein LOC108665564 [Hyalella azteca]